MQGKIVSNFTRKAGAAISLATWSLFIPLGSSWAQPTSPADAGRGHELAARLCTNCHAIDRETSGPIRADVPSFPTIANRPGANAEHLAGRIIVPHPAMPGVPLTRAEIRDIVAYIVSLKKGD
jgi:mono/diheme cytochrome c family protein